MTSQVKQWIGTKVWSVGHNQWMHCVVSDVEWGKLVAIGSQPVDGVGDRMVYRSPDGRKFVRE